MSDTAPRLSIRETDAGREYVVRYPDIDRYAVDWATTAMKDIRSQLVARVVEDLFQQVRAQVAERLTPDVVAALVKEGVVQAVANMTTPPIPRVARDFGEQ